MSCPICDERNFWPVPFADDPDVARWRADLGQLSNYEWRLCRRCGNAYPSQPPDLQVLERLWAQKRADEGLTPAAAEKAWEYRRQISRAGAARSYRQFAPLMSGPPGRFLDVGCGLGETVRTFADHGWDAQGIDPDPSTAQHHRAIGIKAHIGQFEQSGDTSRYDIIHIAHAIYFITDPMNFIRSVRQRLNPGGLFCVVLADLMANADAGRPSYSLTFYPTAASMRYALALAGFDVISESRQSGSIFLAARRADAPKLPRVNPAAILLLHRTKALRYALLGKPYLTARRLAARLLGPRRS
jgi:SAM-dependent methyltransferase